jgi:predicted transcriptional regulator
MFLLQDDTKLCITVGMNGRELRQMAEAAALSPIEVCHEAGINSQTTLYKVYNDQTVRASTRIKVERAIKRLSANSQSQVSTPRSKYATG